MSMLKNKLGQVAAGIIIATSVALLPMNAMTASSVSGNLNGFSCSGRITVNYRSAVATTTINRGDVSVYATAYVYCYSGTRKVTYCSGRASSNNCGVSAMISKKYSGEEVFAAKGVHQAGYGSYTWGPVSTYTERY